LAFVELLRRHRQKAPEKLTMVIGKDVRTSGPRLKAAFTDALLSRGVPRRTSSCVTAAGRLQEKVREHAGDLHTDGERRMLFKFTIRARPGIRDLDKRRIAMFANELKCLPIFPVFISLLAVKSVQYLAVKIIRTIGTGSISPFLEAAHFDLTFCFSNTSFSTFIS